MDESTEPPCDGQGTNDLTRVVVASMSGEVVIERDVDLITCTGWALKQHIEEEHGFSASIMTLFCGAEEVPDNEVIHAFASTSEAVHILMVLHDCLMFEVSANTMGNRVVDPISGMDFGKYDVSEHHDVRVWNMDHGFWQVNHANGKSWTVGDHYTHCCWIFWRPGDNGFRSVLAATFADGRGSNDHTIIIQNGTKDLGIHCNRSGKHRACGHSIDVTKWNFVAVVGKKALDGRDFEGTSEFFVATPEQERPRSVGTSNRVACGGRLDRIGYAGGSPDVGPGKLAFLKCWNRSLTEVEIAKIFTETAPLFK